MIAVVAVSGCSKDEKPAPTPTDRLAAAQQKCDPAKAGTEVADQGKTMIIKTRGEKDPTGIGLDGLACIAVELDMSRAVVAHLDRTNALSGEQQDAWPGYTARWTFHPDSGVNMTIQKA